MLWNLNKERNHLKSTCNYVRNIEFLKNLLCFNPDVHIHGLLYFLTTGLREELLESEDHQCPSCKETNVSPDRIVANRSMRMAVNNFLNDTGYTKVRFSLLN